MEFSEDPFMLLITTVTILAVPTAFVLHYIYSVTIPDFAIIGLAVSSIVSFMWSLVKLGEL
jgi:hypothetical protein